MKRLIAVLFAAALLSVVGVASATSYMSADYELRVNESAKRFNVRKLTVTEGTVKFTVVVPKSAKGKHGVGIDGGPYNNINGASVRPGRSTSLTVALDPGKYTVYDSYKKNRKRGYYVKVTVKEKN